MRVRVFGTRGSVPTPRQGTVGYGGNTACVEVSVADERSLVILDAGTGICMLGQSLPAPVQRIDILLTHLHMDHIIGLGFFSGLFRPDLEVHLWGPGSTILSLRDRLGRYLSPPLFPVRIRELPCQLHLHDVPLGTFDVPSMAVTAALVCHPGPTVGYRLDDGAGTVAYLPDHEPALGVRRFPDRPEWTSGHALASGVDLLIHDAQYDDDEYPPRAGWGHSSISQTMAFARSVEARHLVPFHHDPAHDDEVLDRLFRQSITANAPPFPVTPAREGASFVVGQDVPRPLEPVTGASPVG
jgi:phosphoribosyl 1,2-cyclic phosphodiesterase